MGEITRQLAEFAGGIDYETLPDAVRERTKALVSDHVAIAYRARQEAAITPSIASTLERLGMVGGEASVIGDARTYAPPAAAFFNGALAHCLDFDDTHARSSLHPSAPIVPAALAAAEVVSANGRDCIAAITAGYEVQIRLSLALGPSAHYARGYHPTATCGVFGAAAAAGRILGLGVEEMVHAYGLCGSQAAGSMQFLADGAWNKPFHVGYAAMSGLIAASLGARGVSRRCGCDRRRRRDSSRPTHRSPEPRRGGSQPRNRLGDPGDRSKALPLVPLRTRRDGCVDRAARRPPNRPGCRGIGADRTAADRLASHRRPGAREAEPAELRRRAVLDALRRRGGPARRRHELGQLCGRTWTTRARASLCRRISSVVDTEVESHFPLPHGGLGPGAHSRRGRNSRSWW